MKTYNCGFCKKEFKQKIDYLRHRDRKTPCINMATLNMLSMQKIKNDSDMKTLRTFYSKCFNILRDNELLTGDKALRNLSYLLILKLMESKLEEINFRGYDEYKFVIEDKEIEELFNLTRFSYLGKSKELNIRSQLNAVWDQILSQHPKTKEIFIKNKGFDIKYTRTYTKLIEEISKINFSIIDQDVQGEAYEDILKDTLKGKILGQFFTPPIIKKLCVDLVKPKITQDGKTETIFDLAMGPGGFLLTAVKYLEKEATYKNIKLDWDFISNEGLGGIEAEPDTFQLAKSNMLISTGKLCDNIHLGDSIRNTIEEKYDIVLTNPPFGIKGLNYFDIENEKRDIYLPIKSNSAVPLFIQAIIYILKVNGRCAVVLPNGQELDSSNQDLVAAREYLMKTCDLKEVICLPAGIFTHTSIRTCIFYFVKKKECSFVLETKINYSKKTGKETKRTYEFSKSHSTKSVKFYECNPHTDFKELKADVPIEQIAGNYYSLNYNDYLEEDDEKYEDTQEVKWMKLGDVFIKQNNKIKLEPEETYKIIKMSSKGYSDIREYKFGKDIKTKTLQLCKNGMFVISKILNYCHGFITDKTNNGVLSSEYFVFDINVDFLIPKYVKYIFNPQLKPLLKKISTGVGIPRINLDKFLNIKIPIPSLEKQQEIVSFCESNDRKIKELEEEIGFNKKLSSQILSSIFKSSETIIGDIRDEEKDNTENFNKGEFSNDIQFGDGQEAIEHIIKEENLEIQNSPDEEKIE